MSARIRKHERKIGILSDQEVKRFAQRPQSSTRKARLGFIGAGWWATTNHMPLLKERSDVEMVSVCGLDWGVLERCQKDFGFTHATTDYKELLKHGLDGVVISSPNTFHAEHARAAVRANCHVMVEKPFTTNAREARSIVALARKKKRHIIVPYGWNYRPLTLKAKELFQANSVGEIEFVLCHMSSALKNLFTGKSFDFTTGAYVNAELATWADARLSGGGYGQGQLSHAAGLMLWLTGLRVESVFARMSQPGATVDLYDTLSLRYQGGAVGTVSGAATLPEGTPGAFQLDIRVFGAKGMLHIDIARDHLSLHTHAGRHETFSFQQGAGAYQCDEPPHRFVELILGLSRQNNSSGEVAVRSVELLEAAYQSNRSGKVEKV